MRIKHDNEFRGSNYKVDINQKSGLLSDLKPFEEYVLQREVRDELPFATLHYNRPNRQRMILLLPPLIRCEHAHTDIHLRRWRLGHT